MIESAGGPFMQHHQPIYTDHRNSGGFINPHPGRPNYSHLSVNRRQWEALATIYQDRIGESNEAHLVQYVRDVERILSDNDDICASAVIGDAAASIGREQALKYLIGYKISVLMPVMEEYAAGGEPPIEYATNCIVTLRRLQLLIDATRGEKAKIH
jgi:hypothetical protein